MKFAWWRLNFHGVDRGPVSDALPGPGIHLFIKRLDLAFELDHQRVALAVDLVADGHFDPAFADAVLGDVVALFVVKADADIVLEDGFDEMRAALVGGQMVGQCRAFAGGRWCCCCCGDFFGHGHFLLLVNISIHCPGSSLPCIASSASRSARSL
jgi:hypothetical protein